MEVAYFKHKSDDSDQFSCVAAQLCISPMLYDIGTLLVRLFCNISVFFLLKGNIASEKTSSGQFSKMLPVDKILDILCLLHTIFLT